MVDGSDAHTQPTPRPPLPTAHHPPIQNVHRISHRRMVQMRDKEGGARGLAMTVSAVVAPGFTRHLLIKLLDPKGRGIGQVGGLVGEGLRVYVCVWAMGNGCIERTCMYTHTQIQTPNPQTQQNKTTHRTNNRASSPSKTLPRSGRNRTSSCRSPWAASPNSCLCPSGSSYGRTARPSSPRRRRWGSCSGGCRTRGCCRWSGDWMGWFWFGEEV